MNKSENVFDIRHKEQLYYILPSEYELNGASSNIKKVAVIIYLYYEETLDNNLSYINSIPGDVDVYIISSKEVVLEYLKEHIKRADNVIYCFKENRGRDISALLVTCSQYIENYEIVCFVHDKKEHQDNRRIEDTKMWVSNIWNNTIASGEYIRNVIKVFNDNDDIGLLTIPEPVGLYFDTWMGQGWYKSFDITKKLAESLNLKCDIRRDKPPISIGSVFWFRTVSLRKLFNKGWHYSDFDDELLKDGNYISYAIERIFPYVAQDACYKTGTVMTTSYAVWQMSCLQDVSFAVTECMKELIGITSQYESIIVRQNYIRFRELKDEYSNVYIYGAGRWGRLCLKLLRMLGLEPSGFLTSFEDSDASVDGLPVYLISEDLDKDALIIISVSDDDAKNNMVDTITRLGLNNYYCFWE